MHSGLRLPHVGKRPSASACAVVVAYEDTATRDRAMLLCDHLVERLWEDIDLEISWWTFDYLRDPQIAADAASAADAADLVIFSAHPDHLLPPAVKSWIETWAVSREDRESALVALIARADEPIAGVSPTHLYLRSVAQRARMDYLADLPDALSDQIQDPVEAIMHRAVTVTSVMDRILHQASPPSHWGINE
jgi:hypothetical protein